MGKFTYTVEQLFGYEYKYNGSGTELIYWCPRCNQRKFEDPKLYVGINTGGFQCKKCGYSGWVKVDDYYIENLNGCDRDVMSMDMLRPVKVQEGTDEFNYLISRGLTKQDIDYYDFLSPTNPYYLGCIIATCRDYTYKGFVVRVYDRNRSEKWQKLHEGIRWWNCPGFRSRDTIWNIAHVSTYDTVIITEGIFSAISCGKNSVSMYGKHLSDDQLDLLIRLNACNLVFVYDGGVEEKILAWSYARKLSYSGKNVRVVNLPEGKDPNELRCKLSTYLNNSIPYDDNNYLSQMLSSVRLY